MKIKKSTMFSELSCYSNPFDEILNICIDNLRNAVKYNTLKEKDNNKLDEPFDLESLVRSNQSRLFHYYRILEDLPSEEREFLRKESSLLTKLKVSTIDEFMDLFLNKLSVISNGYMPYTSDNFEVFKFGKDSETYKRLKYLRDSADRDFTLNSDSLNDVLSLFNGKPDMEDRRKSLAQNIREYYNLRESECIYLLAYIEETRYAKEVK